MGLFARVMRWLGWARPAPSDNGTRPRFRSKFDAAQTNDDNRRHWANADGLSAAAANSLDVRRTLRNRSRYERDNNGYLGGMARSLAYDHVGTGPMLQILADDDDETNSRIEAAFAAWAKAVHLGEKLWTMRQARAVDGEAFAVLTTTPAIADPVQLDLRLIEADQVTDPQLVSTGTNTCDGIEYDAYGNPVAYTVLRQHPGDTLRVWPAEYDRIPARNVIHWFRRDRPGQLRGVPEFTTALPLCSQQRRWTGATLTAAETAADFAAVLQTDNPAIETTPPDPFESVEIDRGLMVTLPNGAKLGQLKAEHPTTTYPDFKREIVAESARTVGMPVNVAMADSSRHNFSSAKLDHFGYRGGLRVERSHDDLNLLEPIFAAWLAEARLVPGHLPEGLDVAAKTRGWFWPGWPSMDKDEAKHDTERLANGSTNLAELYAEWGQDWRVMLRQRGREVALCRELGLPIPGETKPANEPSAMPADDAPPPQPARQPSRRRPREDDAADARHYRNGRHG